MEHQIASVLCEHSNNMQCRLKLSCGLNQNKNELNSNQGIVFFAKTPIRKCTTSYCSISISSAPPLDNNSSKHTTLLVESYHQHRTIHSLVQRLKQKDACPLLILQQDGDWTKDHFWVVINFLKIPPRSNQILQVFDMWKDIEKSRINEINYQKIVGILSELGLMEEAVQALRGMKGYGLRPSVKIYNSLIHGFSKNGKLNDAFLFLNEMKEMNFSPKTGIYNGIIQAYGKCKMYDEIDMWLKKMELDGCSPDHMTYNLVIREFARGGLLKRMEGVYQNLISRRMHLQSSSLIAMLEAYMNFGILDRMEKCYKRLLKSRTPLNEDLIRKLAEVYIKNYMFSKLDDLGDDLASRTGRTELVWHLRLLSHACLLSRRGMGSVVQEMEDAKVSWNVTTANIILLAFLKMRDFKRLRVLLSELPTHCVKPDIVTIGILFDASRFGFDGTGALEMWRRNGFLHEHVEIKTDSLVLTVYGKGYFLRDCENVYRSLEPTNREKNRWTYRYLIDLVMKWNGRQLL